jgi:D-alanyl-D-alanine carboxypeptidase/D-alanyl-D-alanine-endopeptidase (penicillin-binding protein 4)
MRQAEGKSRRMNSSSAWFRGLSMAGALALSALPGGAQTPAPKAATPKAVAVPGPRTVEELQARLEAHVTQARFNGALWGMKIVSLDSGKTWFEHHADRLMSPASNSKLYTGAMALDRLGGDYRIVTPILATAKPESDGTLKGDVIVSGRADPNWRAREAKKDFWTTFEPFIAALEKAGVKRISGDIVADATWIVGLPNGSGWTADDLNDYYGAEISAVSLEDGYAEMRVTPGAKIGDPCTVAMVLPGTGLVLDNRTKTIAKEGKRRIETVRLLGENVVHIFGELPVGDKEELADITVPKPAQWFANALKEALIKKGIQVGGVARSLRWPDAPATGVKIGEVTSPTMRELVHDFMKPSQNLETDLIFAHVGQTFRAADAPAGRTSEDSALLVLRDFLKKNGLPVEEVRFDEGSGLSRNNLVSANATVALLKFMATHKEGKAFDAALPIAGVDGTLRRRLKGTVAEGKVRAKTGTLRYAISLSGYTTTAAGERVAFSAMLNRNVQPAGRNVRDELDDVAVMLAGLGAK